MGIDVEQWRAKIGLWHAFTTGRPLVRRRRCKPFRGISVRRHECKRAFKARQNRRQKTSVRCQFLPFVVVLTLFVVVDSRINTFNNLSCRLTSTRFYPAIRLAATLFLVGSNKYGSMDKRRNTGMEPRSLISQHSVMTVLAMLLILAGDIELNPGPSKLEASTDLAFLCSLPLGAEWRNLGTRLLVPEHQLNTIQAIHAHSPNHLQDCLNSMFAFWLNNCPEPTCEFLIQAVDAIGRRDVVTVLHQKYYGFVPPTGTSQSGGQYPYQASAHRLPPQQPDTGYQPTPAQSQPLQQGFVPPSGTSQSGGQFPYQASAQHLPPQQPATAYQPTLVPSQPFQQGMYGFEHGVQFPQPQQQYHAHPQQQQPYLSLPSGQLTGGLSKPTKPQLMKELFSTVASEWHHIGTYLEISNGELSTIAEREHGDPQKSLMAMLSVWLERISPPASWSDIADAVEVIGRANIAQQIRQKYCIQGFQQGAQLLQHQQQQPQHIQAPYMHPAGPEQLQKEYQHGIQQPPLGQQQSGYTQPQYGVHQPPPGQDQAGHPQLQHGTHYQPPGQLQPGYLQLQHGTHYQPPGQLQPGYLQLQYGTQYPHPSRQQSSYPRSQYNTQYSSPCQQQPRYPQLQHGGQQLLPEYSQPQQGTQHPHLGQQQPQPPHSIQQPPVGQQQSGYAQPQHSIKQLPVGQQQPGYTQQQHSIQQPPVGRQQPRYAYQQHSIQQPPVGQKQPGYAQEHHGTQQLLPGQEQAVFPQPQNGAQQPLPRQEKTGFPQQQHGTQQPPIDQEQAGLPQLQHDTQQPPLGQQQPGYTQPQHDAQHLHTDQQYLTTTELQQSPIRRPFTGESQLPQVSVMTHTQQTPTRPQGEARTQIPTSTDQELGTIFTNENRAAITAKFAAFQTKVCDKLIKNGVDIEQFRLFVINQFPPGDCIPPPPASLTDIFKAITYHGLWDYLHYSPLVRIVQMFGANDTEMESWVQDYENDLKAYTIVTELEVYVEPDLDTAAPPPAKRAKYDRRYYCPVEWKTKFVNHSLEYLADMWKMFSCRYLVPDSPPTALLDRVHKGCYSVTWLIPSHLIPSLIERMKTDTDFFKQHHILTVTVGEECDYKELTQEHTLVGQKKEILLSKASLVPQGGAEPHGYLKVKTFGGYDCKFVEEPPSVFQTDCPVCHLLLREPYQATCCGTSFCHYCILHVKAGDKPCPVCRQTKFELFQDKRHKRSLHQLHVLCTYSKDGCNWSGELGDLDHQLNEVIHPATRSSADVPHDSEVDSTPLDVYAEKLKARYTCKPKRKNIWPPQITKKYFNLTLIKEETVRKGELSDKFTRLTITGKIEDILKHKEPIKLPEVFKKTADDKKMTILMEGCPGSGKTVLTQHLCLQWVHGKLFQAYKLVILVRLREPAIHNAKEVKEVIPRVGMEEDAMKEIESSHGKGILFILDGWDELPEDVPGHDTIYNIINRETLPDCDVVVTSRPTSSASLHDTDLISSRIEILGFTPGELQEFFTEHLDGDATKAQILLQIIKANPIVAGTCALPLNAAILVFVFKQHGVLPSTEHGIFEALIISCILRHLKERTQLKIKDIESLTDLPHEVQDAHSDLCKTAYEGVMKDQVIFKRSGDFNTLGLLQAVECFTYKGTKYFYNFLHLSIQEFLAAQHIATFEPTKQVEEFNKLFGQARFSSTFRHYSAITKLATPGIKEIVLRILKRCAAGHPRREDKAHLLSLLNCLHEAQEPPLYAFVADNLGPKLDLGGITLNPADCLSINFFLRNATEIELNLILCSIDAEGVKMLFSQDQVYQLRVLNLGRNKIGPEGVQHLVTVLEKMVQLKKLYLGRNEIGAEGVQHLVTVLEKMVQLKELDLGGNELNDGGVDAISTSLTKLVHLRKLYLAGNQISDSGCITLCDAVHHCTELQVLGLYSNRNSDSSIQTLCDFIKSAKSLKELYLFDNQFTREGEAQLRKARKERNPDCVKLETLWM